MLLSQLADRSRTVGGPRCHSISNGAHLRSRWPHLSQTDIYIISERGILRQQPRRCRMRHHALSWFAENTLCHGMTEHMANLLLAEPASLTDFCKRRFLVYWKRFCDAVVYDNVQANEIRFLECGEGWAKRSVWRLNFLERFGAGVVSKSKNRMEEKEGVKRE